MLQTFVKQYYDFFDAKIKSSSAVVLIIACIICGVGVSASGYEGEILKANMFEYENTKEHRTELIIDGVEYEIIIQALHK